MGNACRPPTVPDGELPPPSPHDSAVFKATAKEVHVPGHHGDVRRRRGKGRRRPREQRSHGPPQGFFMPNAFITRYRQSEYSTSSTTSDDEWNEALATESVSMSMVHAPNLFFPTQSTNRTFASSVTHSFPTASVASTAHRPDPRRMRTSARGARVAHAARPVADSVPGSTIGSADGSMMGSFHSVASAASMSSVSSLPSLRSVSPPASVRSVSPVMSPTGDLNGSFNKLKQVRRKKPPPMPPTPPLKRQGTRRRERPLTAREFITCEPALAKGNTVAAATR